MQNRKTVRFGSRQPLVLDRAKDSKSEVEHSNPLPLQETKEHQFDESFLPALEADSAFPVESLPEQLKDTIVGAATAWATHVSYLTVALIAAVLGLVGKRITIEVDQHHHQHC